MRKPLPPRRAPYSLSSTRHPGCALVEGSEPASVA
jgi:hypothetical protein